MEGSAEWMAFNVAAALRLDDLDKVRARLLEKVRALKHKDQLPRLTRVDTFDQWVEARNRYSFDGTYSLSFLVADFLVERHSFARIADYYRRFERSDDPTANFRAAFGEDVDAFERQLEIRLDQLLK